MSSRESPSARHLVRAMAVREEGSRDLSGPAGMARLVLEEIRLPPGGEAGIGADARGEQFLYVLAGTGTLSSRSQATGVVSGDFVALDAGEPAKLKNDGDGDLVCLRGGEKS